MEINELKIELLKRMLNCDNVELLIKVEKLLVRGSLMAEDPSGDYYVGQENIDLEVPDSFYNELEDDYRKFLKGDIKAKSWEELKRGFEMKNGV